MWHLSISDISQLLVTLFEPDFKIRFLGPSLTDASCHGEICPGNICPDDICPFLISQMLKIKLTWFWRNFKRRFLWLSLIDFNCRTNICPGNICPDDICPHQECLSCYWHKFDQTLKVGSWDPFEHIPTVIMTFFQATFVLTTFVHNRNISVVYDLILTKL